MQVVGSICHVCNSAINFAPEGGECPLCGITFHKGCLDEPERCPKCHGNWLDALRVRASAAADIHRSNAVGGRRIIVIAASVLLGLQLLVAAGAYAVFGVESFGLELARLILLGAAFAALYCGFKWARTWLCVVLGLAVLVSLGTVVSSTQNGRIGVAVSAGILLAIYATLLIYIAFSERVTIYMNTWKG